MSTATRHPARRPRRRRVVVGLGLLLGLVLVLLTACDAADDGVRVRDRDGAGVLFEEES